MRVALATAVLVVSSFGASAENFVLAEPATPLSTEVNVSVIARDNFAFVEVLQTKDSLADPAATARLVARDDGVLAPAWILEEFSFAFATLAGAGTVTPLGIPVELEISLASYRSYVWRDDMSGPTPENDVNVPPGRSFDALNVDVHFVGALTVDGVSTPFNHTETIICLSFGCFNPSPNVRWWAVSSPPLSVGLATRVPMQSDVFDFDVVTQDGLTYAIEHWFQVDDVPFLVPEPAPAATALAVLATLAALARRSGRGRDPFWVRSQASVTPLCEFSEVGELGEVHG